MIYWRQYLGMSLIFSLLTSSRSFEFVDRNDTQAYFNQFKCEYYLGDMCYKYASEEIAFIFNAIFKIFSSLYNVNINVHLSFNILMW